MTLRRLVRAAISGGPYYIKLARDRLVVRNSSSGAVFDDIPFVALSDDSRPHVLAVGSAARNASLNCVNPFDHPRIIVADYLLAERLMQYAFWAVSGSSWLQPSPIAVCHVVEPLAGGLSAIERRALQELLEGAGARKAYIWQGRELTDEELQSGAYLPAT